MDLLFSLPDDAGIIDTELSLNFISSVVKDQRKFRLGPTGLQVGLTPRYCLAKGPIHLKEHDNVDTFVLVPIFLYFIHACHL